jgi:hypothetical protein
MSGGLRIKLTLLQAADGEHKSNAHTASREIFSGCGTRGATQRQTRVDIQYSMPMHWDANETEHGEEVTLRAEDYKWRSSMFMPKEVCRIKLKITDIRAERLRDITEKDAKAEGIRSYWAEPHEDTSPFVGAAKELGMDLCFTRVEAFQQLWDFLNLKRGYGWNTNPWVWVVCFEKVAP